MKELSIEEKAKEFKKNPFAGYDGTDLISSLFPQLRESEDERIRKELLNYLYDVHDDDEERASWIAWIEKNEQKPTEEYNITGIKSKHAQGKLGEMIKRKLEMEKQGEQILANSAKTCKDEQKPDDKKGMNLDEDEMTPFQKKVFCIIDTTIEEEQGLKQVCDELLRLAHDEIMQNTAWSEEDDIMVHDIDYALKCQITYSISRLQSMSTWILNLKDRVQLQPKQEWSEEDETVLNNLIYALANDKIGNNRDEYVDWLKDLKNRVLPKPAKWSEEDEKIIGNIRRIIEQYAFSKSAVDVNGELCEKEFINADNWLKSLRPQTTWKPSEEQIEALKYSTYCPNKQMSKVLFELYQDLKNL